MPKLRFAKPAIEALTPPAKGFATYHDTATPNLVLLVSAGGAKTFYRYGRIEGKPHRTKIGRWPGITIEQARKICAKLTGEIASGKNPHAERKAARGGDTLDDLFRSYIEKRAKPHLRPQTRLKAEQQFENYLAHWRTRKAKDLKRSEIEAWHVELGSKTPYQANRALALLSVILSHGEIYPNPCRRVRKFREESRDRYLHADELPAFFAALDSEPNQTFADCVRIALFTGARIGNVLAMRWDEVSLDARLWRIPDPKNRTPHVIALAPEALQVLGARYATAESEWVFPGRGGKGHLKYPKSTWKRFLKRAGIEDLRIHDLRRTHGSWQAAAGASLSVIGASLGHKSVQTTKVYARLDVDPIRASVETAVAAMVAASKPEQEAEKPRKRRAAK